jgi:transposase
VEGTGAYGAALSRLLHSEGVQVVEVDRPDRKTRRAKGNSDPIDAYAAALAALSGRTAGPRPPGHPGRQQKLALGRTHAHTIVTVHVAEHTITIAFPDGAQRTLTRKVERS